MGSGPAADQVVSILGSQQASEQVMQAVNREVMALNKEDWFDGWASTSGAVAQSAGPKGGGKKGKGSDHGKVHSPPPANGAITSSRGSYSASSTGSPRDAGIDLMMRVARGLPSYTMDDPRGFALSCVVPNALVGGLIGRGGAGTKEVQSLTGTKIGIRDIPGDTENRSLNIA